MCTKRNQVLCSMAVLAAYLAFTSAAYAGAQVIACCLPDGNCQEVTDVIICTDVLGGAPSPGLTCDEANCDPEACCLDGVCYDLVPPAECLNSGGIPQGFGSDCSNVDCGPPTGEEACCFSDGSCNVLPAPDCLQMGGIPQGVPDCSLANCGGGGLDEACCFPDGSCLMIPAVDCSVNGGSPQGAGSICTAGLCPIQDLEACCFPDGSCADLLPSDCVAQGGNPAGAGSDCLTTTCPQPTEACCFSDGTCGDLVVADCQLLGGVPQGPGTACATTICFPPEDEACCFNDGTCSDIPAPDCIRAGGMPQGAGTNCVTVICDIPEEREACCFQDGSCADLYPFDCTALGGTPQGAGTNCATVICQDPQSEACCLPDGTCSDLLPSICQTLGGTPQGPGSNCATTTCPQHQREACCFPDGTCQMRFPADCVAAGGNPQGPGSNCATSDCPVPTIACCLTDGTCIDTTAADCAALGGAAGPAGSTCAQTTCPGDQEEIPCCLFDGTCGFFPPAICYAFGRPIPGGVCLGDADGNGVDDACEDPPASGYRFEFSVDIGSDSELSDPFADGDEAFDPGDVYYWLSAPVEPPGRDGFKDDAIIFLGTDPIPSAPDFSVPPATAAPVGTGSIQDYFEWFDLDAHDQLDFSINELSDGTGGPNGLVITPPSSQCFYEPKHLFLSFDDDRSLGYVAGDVAVTSSSPAGVVSYGTTGGRDEVIGIDTLPGVPYMIMSVYPFADERGVHSSLAPNPDVAQEDDDDVDSLDVVPFENNENLCPIWYFSPDHEAVATGIAGFGPLDPGGIYEVTPLGPIQVIDEAAHLGLSERTDIDAFEFAWLTNDDTGAIAFGVIFSVDDDDPLTAGDESGGLSPGALYASTLMGFSYRFLEEDLGDDIDALTIWRASLDEPEPPIEACCFGDGTCADLLSTDCLLAGGTPLGVGSTCATSHCRGACCDTAAGTCTNTPKDDCFEYVCDVTAINGGVCLGDADGSGVVNASDRGAVSANIGISAADVGTLFPDINAFYDALCLHDMDGSGVVNASDRGIVSANVGLCSPLNDFQNGSGLNSGSPDPRFPHGTWKGYGTTCATTTCP